MSVDIVVVSTAGDARAYARACAKSVAEQGARHLYLTADRATFEEASAGGACAIYSPKPALVNAAGAWGACNPSEVVVWLDGDDRLLPGALQCVRDMYEDPDVWLTYGSFVRDDGVRDYRWHAPFGQRYRPGQHRREPWRASHLKTFRAGVVQAIPFAYLCDARGRVNETCTDLTVMYPALDLVGERYLVCVEFLCVYNFAHSFQARDPEACERAEAPTRAWVRSLPPLPALERRPW